MNLPPPALLTEAEARVAVLLGDAWNLFLELPTEHPSDRGEFLHAVHAAQSIILARPGRRQINAPA